MLFESLSKGCIARLMQAVKRGQVEGVMTALGGNTVKFIKISPDISLYSWGIMIQDIPTDEDVKMILEQMGLGQQQSLFRPQDIFIIKSSDNLKQMEQRIGYLYEKRWEEAEASKKQMITLQSQSNTQGAIAIEQETQKTLQLEYQLKKDLELSVKAADKEMLLIKLEYEKHNKTMDATAKMQGNVDQAHGKIISSSITADASIQKQLHANEGMKEKQEIANEKKAATA